MTSMVYLVYCTPQIETIISKKKNKKSCIHPSGRNSGGLHFRNRPHIDHLSQSLLIYEGDNNNNNDKTNCDGVLMQNPDSELTIRIDQTDQKIIIFNSEAYVLCLAIKLHGNRVSCQLDHKVAFKAHKSCPLLYVNQLLINFLICSHL